MKNKELWGIYDTATEISLVEKEIWDRIEKEVITTTRSTIEFNRTTV
jgi:hypothetical protein